MMATDSEDLQAENEDERHHDLPAPKTPIADLQRRVPEGFPVKGRLDATITSGGSTNNDKGGG
jgi:hypothetical protein